MGGGRVRTLPLAIYEKACGEHYGKFWKNDAVKRSAKGMLGTGVRKVLDER